MSAFLFTVTETIVVPGLGIVLLPELKPVGTEKFNVGDPLRLRRPNGREDSVRIGGLEFLQPLDGKCQLVVMLSGMKKVDSLRVSLAEKQKYQKPADPQRWQSEPNQKYPKHQKD